jgi:hypothetical protein
MAFFRHYSIFFRIPLNVLVCTPGGMSTPGWESLLYSEDGGSRFNHKIGSHVYLPEVHGIKYQTPPPPPPKKSFWSYHHKDLSTGGRTLLYVAKGTNDLGLLNLWTVSTPLHSQTSTLLVSPCCQTILSMYLLTVTWECELIQFLQHLFFLKQ